MDTGLTALSPVDGRYRAATEGLAQLLSEGGLVGERIRVEALWLLQLGDSLPDLPAAQWSKAIRARLEQLATDPGADSARKVKAIEKVINHDVKAVEYFLKERLEEAGLDKQKEFVHFALTSQDINNTALPLLIKDFLFEAYLPAIITLRDKLHGFALEWSQVAMLARTHGQPACPTTLGQGVAGIRRAAGRTDRPVAEYTVRS